MNMKPQYDFSWIPLLLHIRVFVGVILAIISAVLNYDGMLLNQLFTVLPYAVFIVCLVLFYKKLLHFRLWYVAGAVLNIGVLLYLSASPIVTIVVDVILVAMLFLSSYIKEHYKKSGE